MNDINEKKSQKDTIILNKSTIDHHLKSQFSDNNSIYSPKLKLQAFLTTPKKFSFDEQELLNNSVNYSKNEGFMHEVFSNKNS